jgi:DNA-binding NarL/FixJ family response regulator
MRALADLRDPLGLVLAAATVITLLAVQEGPVVAILAAVSVLAFRVAAGPLVGRWARRLSPTAVAPPPPSGTHERKETGEATEAREWFWPLTPRQAEVGLCLAEGLSNKETATRLQIGVDGVETHVFNIMNKLNLHNRTQIGVWITERRSHAAQITKPIP